MLVVPAGNQNAVSICKRLRHRIWNFTSTCACIAAGLPSFMPGLNLHCLTASTAFSSRPRPKPRFTDSLAHSVFRHHKIVRA
jgi:hypothetical protein